MSGENQTARLEHVNLTVSDPRATAAMLEAVFGWRVRWEGASIGGGFTMHVGGAGDYVALYTPPEPPAAGGNSYATVAALNHIGVVVDDLDGRGCGRMGGGELRVRRQRGL